MSKTFTAYVTKYALTKGILEMQVEDCAPNLPGVVRVDRGGPSIHFHGEGRDWHRTQKGARQRAEKMRSRKIDSLAFQIDRLRLMFFDAPVKVE